MLLAPSSAEASAELRKTQALVAEPSVVLFSKFGRTDAEASDNVKIPWGPGERLNIAADPKAC